MKNENTKQFAEKYAGIVTDKMNSDEGKKLFKEFCLRYYKRYPDTEITEQKVQELQEVWQKFIWLILLTDKESPIKDEFGEAVWKDLRADDTDGTDTTTAATGDTEQK